MAYLTSQSCGDLQLAACLSRRDETIIRPPEQLQISDKPKKQTTIKAAWVTFSTGIHASLLLNVYSDCVMVKSVPSCLKLAFLKSCIIQLCN